MGPEGECEVDLLRINGLIHRVRKRLPVLCPLSAELQRVFLRAQASFEAVCNEIKRYSQDDPDRDTKRCAIAESAGPEPARNRPAAEAVANGSCQLCIIDKTSVLVVAGSGPDAMIARDGRLCPEFGVCVLCVSSWTRRSKRSNRETLLVRRAQLPGWPLIRRLRRFESPGARLVPRGRQPDAEAGVGHVARGSVCAGEAGSSTAAALAATGVRGARARCRSTS